MSCTAGIALSITAVALWIAAVPARAPRLLRVADRPWWPSAARLLGAALGLAASHAFTAAYGPVSGPVTAAAALTASASVFIITLPLLPCVTWSILAAAPVVAALTAALGGLHG